MSRARDFADLASAYSSGALGNRNMIINGDMAVAQRAGTVSSQSGLDYYTVDRFAAGESSNGAMTHDQVTASSPNSEGFDTSFRLDTTTADSSLSSTQYSSILQGVEGLNCQHLNFGTSNAKSLTLSFWCKSNVTGTYSVCLALTDGTSKYQSHTYTISSADTWEKKIITFVGNTATVIPNDNTGGFYVEWGLGSGTGYTSGGATGSAWSNDVDKYFGGLAVNILASTSNDYSLTGVQLEVGEVATPFEHESYEKNLSRCQRYFWKIEASGNNATRFATGQAYTTTGGETYHYPPVTMRAIPSVGQTGTASNYAFYEANSTIACSGVPTVSSGRSKYLQVLYTNVSSGLTAGRALCLMANSSTSAYIAFSAEL